MISVKHKAKAALIKTFLELATDTVFIPSLFLSTLYKVKVLGEDLVCPPAPPYYSDSFFKSISTAIAEGYDVTTMSTRQWYLFLLNDEILLEEQSNSPRQPKPCRVEERSPGADWSEIWARITLPSLTSEVRSLVWRLVHKLLPCEGRVSEIMPNTPPTCRFSCQGDPPAHLLHCFFECRLSSNTGTWLLNLVLQEDPLASPEKILRLEVGGGEAIVWIVAHTLTYVWNRRLSGKISETDYCKAAILADADIMGNTKYSSYASKIKQLVTHT